MARIVRALEDIEKELERIEKQLIKLASTANCKLNSGKAKLPYHTYDVD